jgi:serine/threonine-protein kinase HipA
MAEVTVDVFLGGGNSPEYVGRLYSHRSGNSESSTFAYDSGWLASANAFELEPALPLNSGSHQSAIGKELFGVFTDAAPDRWGQLLIKRAENKNAQKEKRTPKSIGHIDYLLGVRDDVRQGALRFRAPKSDDFIADEHSGVPHMIELGRLVNASMRLEQDVESEEDLRILLRGGSSLGGSWPKAHVLDVGNSLSIAKFPSAKFGDWNVPAWEAVAYELARASEINTPHSELLTVDGKHVFVVRRFDRRGDERIAYASAMTMLEASDGDERSNLEIAEAIEMYSDAANEDLQELWRRIAFSVLINNTDDHLRNHGFIRDAGASGWRLSPVFDINPSAEDVGDLKTAIDESDTTASIDTLLKVAEWFRLDDVRAREIVLKVEKATAEWRSVALRLGIAKAEIERMSPAFEHDQRERAKAL